MELPEVEEEGGKSTANEEGETLVLMEEELGIALSVIDRSSCSRKA